jgi:hypothetical protein
MGPLALDPLDSFTGVLTTQMTSGKESSKQNFLEHIWRATPKGDPSP